MDTIDLDDIRLAYDDTGGDGPSIVCVHGGWSDRHAWDAVVPRLADRHRVVAYDRRGHSDSQRPDGPQPIPTHVADLAALITALDLAPAHLVGNSAGSEIALKTAIGHPRLVASLALHEPPLLALVTDDPQLGPAVADTSPLIDRIMADITRGDHEQAARRFVETIALGPGAWEMLPAEARRTFAHNAPTFQATDPHPRLRDIDLDALADVSAPVLFTQGGQSPPPLRAVIDRLATVLPDARRHTFADAGHVPHRTHPDALADIVLAFLDDVTAPGHRRAVGARP